MSSTIKVIAKGSTHTVKILPRYNLGGVTYFDTAGRMLNSVGSTINVDANFTSTQYDSTYQTLAYGATVAIDMNSGQASELTLTGGATISNPTNIASITPVLIVTQDATGGHAIVFSSNFNVDVSQVTTGATTVTIYNFVVHGSTIYGAGKTFIV